MGKDPEARFQFWWNLEKRTKLVEKYGTNDKKELMAKIAEDIFSDKHPNITPDSKSRMEAAKLKFWEAKAREAEVKATTAEQKALYAGVFHSEPSPQAEQAIKTRAENLAKQQNTSILRSDGTLKCISCGKTFQQKAYGFQQADEYRNHVKNGHNRELYTMENQTCLELANK